MLAVEDSLSQNFIVRNIDKMIVDADNEYNINGYISV